MGNYLQKNKLAKIYPMGQEKQAKEKEKLFDIRAKKYKVPDKIPEKVKPARKIVITPLDIPES